MNNITIQLSAEDAAFLSESMRRAGIVMSENLGKDQSVLSLYGATYAEPSIGEQIAREGRRAMTLHELGCVLKSVVAGGKPVAIVKLGASGVDVELRDNIRAGMGAPVRQEG